MDYQTLLACHIRIHRHQEPVTAVTSTAHKSISGKLASSVEGQNLLYLLFRKFIFGLLPSHGPTPQTHFPHKYLSLTLGSMTAFISAGGLSNTTPITSVFTKGREAGV